MQVIFIKDLKGQGKKEEIKTVKDGYAENFLIKKGYAVPLNEENLAKLKRDQASAKKQDEANYEQAKVNKEKLEKDTFTFQVKTGKEDRVFGSVSPKQIKEALDKKGYKIDKRQIKLENNLTSLGFHTVEIELYKNVSAKIKVQLVK